MTMGEYIRYLRTGGNKFGKVYSLEELGKMLNPPVYRSAVNKWEMGTVVNIKREYIEQLSEIFAVEPTELMCFESKFNEEQISEEVKAIELIQKMFGKQSVQVLQHFTELNKAGKQKILNDIIDMTELPKYTE